MYVWCIYLQNWVIYEVNVGIYIYIFHTWSIWVWLVKSPLDVFIFVLTQDAVTRRKGRGEPDPVSASPGNFGVKNPGDLPLQTGPWMWKAHGFPRKIGTMINGGSPGS